MSRIGANLSGFEVRLLNQLASANAVANLSTLRLSTNHLINAPSDNPSGFVELAGLGSQLHAVTNTLANVSTASAMVSQTQLALDQIRTQLTTIRSLAIADQNQALSPSSRAANQAGIDAAVKQINSLAQSSIGGRSVLDGSADFSYSGVDTSQVANVSASSLGAAAGSITGQVTTPGQQAQLVHTDAGGQIAADATFTLTGTRGAATISVSNGDSLSAAAGKINQQSDLTGVTANVVGNDLQLTSIEYGSGSRIAVSVSSGTFTVTGGNGDGSANGADAVATINGQTHTGAGNRFDVNENRFSFSLEVQGGFTGTLHPISVTGTGLRFSLSTDLGQISTLAIPGLQASRLGGPSGRVSQLATGGALAGLGTSAPMAVRVADEALAQLTVVEGRVDGFANAAITSSSALLSGFETRLRSAIDAIDAVHPAVEEANRAQAELLASNALAGLAIDRANRAGVLQILQSIAGLPSTSSLF